MREGGLNFVSAAWKLWGLRVSLLPSLSLDFLLVQWEAHVCVFLLGAGCSVTDRPIFHSLGATVSMTTGTRSPLHTLSYPRAPVVVVPAQKNFSCPGAAGVYGKRVGRREGKLATVWLGGREGPLLDWGGV